MPRKRSDFFVRAFTRTVRGEGTRWLGYERVRFQQLMKRVPGRFFGTRLVILDEEEVPDQALIDLGIFGESPWKSKFFGTGADFNVDYDGYYRA